MRESKLGSSGYPRVPLSTGMRVLFGVLGIAALVPVVLIVVNEFRSLGGGSIFGPVVMIAFCVVVFLGAVSLLQAAVQGTAIVRRPRGTDRSS